MYEEILVALTAVQLIVTTAALLHYVCLSQCVVGDLPEYNPAVRGRR